MSRSVFRVSGAVSVAKTHGMEAYLVAIYTLEAEGDLVLSSHVADYLRVSRPTITQTVHRMSAMGLVQSGESREIILTEAGRTQAEQVVRRHRLLERWLFDELGIDWAATHAEADRLEHALSPMVEQRLMEKMSYPTTCPHGNVIPGSGYDQQRGRWLSECAAGETVQVIRITEQAEEDIELLRLLYGSGLVPGAIVHIVGRLDIPDKDVELQLSIGTYAFVLTKSAAKRIVVFK